MNGSRSQRGPVPTPAAVRRSATPREPGSRSDNAAERGRWFPNMPPALDGEDDTAYTDRLTGADGTGRVPYDHRRNRQCSLGWHSECSDRLTVSTSRRCQCPCHAPKEEM